jgi:hypothetical protein
LNPGVDSPRPEGNAKGIKRGKHDGFDNLPFRNQNEASE